MSNDEQNVAEVKASLARAERKIEQALSALVAELGPNWILDIDVGAIDVSTLERRGWIWRASINAKLSTEARP